MKKNTNKKVHKRLTDEDRALMVSMIKADKPRGVIANFFGIDSTGVDKVRSGVNSNPLYLKEKWGDLSEERKCELCKKIETGEMSLTSVVNGWFVHGNTVKEFSKKLKAKHTTTEPDSLSEIEVLKTVVRNCKKYYSPKFGEATDRVVMSAVIEALGENE